MPLKRKRKNVESNGVEKSQSVIITVFKKYNSDKVTIQGIKNFAQVMFYRIGYTIEVDTGFALDTIFNTLNKVYRVLNKVFKNAVLFLDKLTDAIMDDLGEPFAKIGLAVEKISNIIKETKNDKSRNTGSEVKRYVQQGIKKHKDLAREIYYYIFPVLTGSVFFLIVGINLSREYAINVKLNGQNIGTITNYTVLENADKIIENKLVSTDDKSWNLDSEIKIVSLGNKETVNERQLANNILSASGEDIVEATGLYVDGEFYGAVKDPTKLNAVIRALKAPYENGDENRTVSFVQSVSVLDGVFFTDGIVDDDVLAEMVGSEVSGEKHYTVIAGDSPSLIASKNGITTRQLYSLNPEKELDNGGGLWVGDDLIVGASVPFLQVKYVETSTRQVEIPFSTKTEKNNSMALGTTKVSQAGEKGLKEEVVETVYIDGVLQSETVIQSTVLKEPVTQITQSGTLYNGTPITGGTGKCIWPVGGSGGRVSRGFAGQYPAHNGVDIAAAYGTPILAADGGVVIKALYTNVGYGIYCEIEHGGYQTLYGHCSSLAVTVGQQVSQGQIIAYMGSTGNSTGNHLHFEVKRGSVRYDPYGWF